MADLERLRYLAERGDATAKEQLEREQRRAQSGLIPEPVTARLTRWMEARGWKVESVETIHHRNTRMSITGWWTSVERGLEHRCRYMKISTDPSEADREQLYTELFDHEARAMLGAVELTGVDMEAHHNHIQYPDPWEFTQGVRFPSPPREASYTIHALIIITE